MDGLHLFFFLFSFCTFLSEAYSSNLFWQPFQLEILSYMRNRYFSHNPAMWSCIFRLSLPINAKAEILKCFQGHSCGAVKGSHVWRVSGFSLYPLHWGDLQQSRRMALWSPHLASESESGNYEVFNAKGSLSPPEGNISVCTWKKRSHTMSYSKDSSLMVGLLQHHNQLGLH